MFWRAEHFQPMKLLSHEFDKCSKYEGKTQANEAFWTDYIRKKTKYYIKNILIFLDISHFIPSVDFLFTKYKSLFR